MNDAPPYIVHDDIDNFVQNKINLRDPYLGQIRTQANNVRAHIGRYIDENPEVGLTKTILSGSLAKHTALKTIDDIDIGLYVSSSIVGQDMKGILTYIKERLDVTYPPSSVKIDEPCVVIHFSGTDLDVEIMPILFDGDENGYGEIFDRSSLKKTYTSIPRHLDFIKNRRVKNPKKFAEIVRLAKHWNKVNDAGLRSFVIELIVAKMSDLGVSFDDYKEALKEFFSFILKNDLTDPLFFTDFFPATDFKLGSSGSEIETWDPVTPGNNVTNDVSKAVRESVVDSAEDALDAITYADRATTKAEALESWKLVLGNSFN